MHPTRLFLSCLLLTACAQAPVPKTLPPPQRPQAFLEVFLRSFQDSNGDGVGDLQGFLARADTLGPGAHQLDVDGVWFMPIHPSPSHHGYDVTNFTAVHPDLGTLEDFQAVVTALHQKNMRVLLDFVPNHTSSQHPWFQSALAGGPERSMYVFRADNPGWKQPFGDGPAWHAAPGGGFYLGVFWSGMPDLNHHDARVRKELLDAARTWLRRGVDGFRLDAVRYLFENGPDAMQDLPETVRWLETFRQELRREKPDVLLVGEVWAPSMVASWYRHAFNHTFDFDLAQVIIWSVQGAHAGALATEVARIQADPQGWDLVASFVGNHDLDRLATRLHDDGAIKAAASLLLLLPGTAFLYAGDEWGTPNGGGEGDLAKRAPLAWTPAGGFTSGTPWQAYGPDMERHNWETQSALPESVLNHHRRLLELRHRLPALATNVVTVVPTSEPALFAMLRGTGSSSVLVLQNLGPEAIPPLTLLLPAQGRAGQMEWRLETALMAHETRVVERW